MAITKAQLNAARGRLHALDTTVSQMTTLADLLPRIELLAEKKLVFVGVQQIAVVLQDMVLNLFADSPDVPDEDLDQLKMRMIPACRALAGLQRLAMAAQDAPVRNEKGAIVVAWKDDQTAGMMAELERLQADSLKALAEITGKPA